MIKHWWYKGYGGKRYLCNGACSVTPEKIADKTRDVTCKNCLHLLSTREYLNTKDEFDLIDKQIDEYNKPKILPKFKVDF